MKTALKGTTLLALSLSTLPAHAEDLVVGMFGGNFAKAVTQCHVQPFEAASGDTVIPQEGSSSQFASMVRATGGRSDFDVIYIDNSFAAQLAGEGLSEPLDRARISHAADLPASVWGADDHFVQFQWAATTIAYNPKAYPTPPDSWQAVFDAAPSGKLALPDIAGTAGVHFLLAAAKLHGGSLENLDPGFDAIKAIAPQVKAWYTQADQIIAMFERGEVDIAPWYQDRAAAAAAAGVPVAIAYPKEGAIGINVTMVIPKGAANPEGAYRYIDTVLSPEAQKCLADVMYEGPVNSKVALEGPAAAALPPGVFDKLDFPDPVYVAAHVADWRSRWQREVTR